MSPILNILTALTYLSYPINLVRLHASTGPRVLDLPGLKLHKLGGRRKGIWSVWVSGNWRVTFQFNDKDAEVVDYEDYH